MEAPSLSLVVPMYNEEGSVASLINDIHLSLKSINYELILVDDKSEDETVETVQNLLATNHKLVLLERNYGQSTAIKAGLDYCSADTIAILDADGQNRPDDILPMLQILTEEKADLVQGIRSLRADSLLKLITSKIANSLMRALLGIEILDSGCALKVFKRSILTDFPFFNGYHRLFSVIAQKRGAKIVQVNVKHQSRTSGESNYGVERIPLVIKHILALKKSTSAMSQELNYSVNKVVQKAD